MGQVPEKTNIPYLIVGNGKLAKHLKHYFYSLEIPFSVWTRNSLLAFDEVCQPVKKILLAINDNAIEEFITADEAIDKTWIHFSGALNTHLAESVHPLMTFSDQLYNESFYKSIPFVTIKGRPDFINLFPEFPNPHYQIEFAQKTLYHAWCSMAGNFSSILWSEFFKVFENKFGIDRSAAFPYLEKISENLMSSNDPLTGPLARGDDDTIQKHMSALDGQDIANVYNAFVSFYNNQPKSK